MISNSISKKASFPLSELIQLRLISKKKKKTEIIWTKRHMILAWLDTIIVRKWAISLMIVQSQKTNFSLKNLLVDGCRSDEGHIEIIRLGTVYLLPAPLSKRHYRSQGPN